MAGPPILAVIHVPLRRRNDGWSPELQLRFIEMLASGATPGEAARRLGKNRQNAYALRGRPCAESFAAAWDAAVAWARRRRTAAEPAARAPEGAARRPAGGAGAIGMRDVRELSRAAARSPGAREALALLEALGSPNSDNSDTAGAPSFSPGGPRLPVLPAKSVAFRASGLRRGPC
jgi:hypothetical protein